MLGDEAKKQEIHQAQEMCLNMTANQSFHWDDNNQDLLSQNFLELYRRRLLIYVWFTDLRSANLQSGETSSFTWHNGEPAPKISALGIRIWSILEGLIQHAMEYL